MSITFNKWAFFIKQLFIFYVHERPLAFTRVIGCTHCACAFLRPYYYYWPEQYVNCAGGWPVKKHWTASLWGGFTKKCMKVELKQVLILPIIYVLPWSLARVSSDRWYSVAAAGQRCWMKPAGAVTHTFQWICHQTSDFTGLTRLSDSLKWKWAPRFMFYPRLPDMCSPRRFCWSVRLCFTGVREKPSGADTSLTAAVSALTVDHDRPHSRLGLSLLNVQPFTFFRCTHK